ncbi:hypothetical protein HaLaN_25655 [Haematococcus lacustris]|uniref:Uncharacterized protein n=1 Tax=Haematococcus lacustris TaxID=44745 RepID=A0A6A0A0G8_HAELA|nr:hypothetical protein HaLaN_25655 [Haematococcus lacustris]
MEVEGCWEHSVELSVISINSSNALHSQLTSDKQATAHIALWLRRSGRAASRKRRARQRVRKRLVPLKASNDRSVGMAGATTDVIKVPEGRCAARVQEDQAQATGAPPAAG